MRITFISANLDLSGGSRVIATHARMLAERGHAVTVVAPARRTPPLRRRLRHWLATGHWWAAPKIGPSHYDGLGLDVRRRPTTTLDENDLPDADILVATWWETAEWVNACTPRKGRKVYFVQGHEVFDRRHLERVVATYHMPMRKIVVSGWLQRIMAHAYGDRASVLVPNAIDHAQFSSPPRQRQPEPTLGFMYAPAALKGSHVILQAVARMRKELPQLRVMSFGAHAPHGVAGFDKIEFQLLPTADQLRNAYASCDVWLCASNSEGFGLPALEAMGCRTPVVSTPVGWAMDAISDGVNGFLVPVDDAPALGDAALRVLRLDDAQWRAMSRGAHDTASAYTWDRSSAQFEAVLQELVR